jgi:hypothetical protein
MSYSIWRSFEHPQGAESSGRWLFARGGPRTGPLDKLQDFLLEFARGFVFVARRQRISSELKDFYVELIFYNRILKWFRLVGPEIS